jgi:hypothetical protein
MQTLVEHALVENTKRHAKTRATTTALANSFIETDVIVNITERLLAKRGKELFGHGKVMTGPMTMLDGVTISAGSRALRANYSFEMAQDAQTKGTLDEELFDILCEEFYAEFCLEIVRLSALGLIMVPYILLDGAISMDPMTFSPIMSFKTRYGTMPTPKGYTISPTVQATVDKILAGATYVIPPLGSPTIRVTDEAAADAQALIADMPAEQFREFLENSIRFANRNRLTIDKTVTANPDGSLKDSYTLKFQK